MSNGNADDCHNKDIIVVMKVAENEGQTADHKKLSLMRIKALFIMNK